LSVERNTLVAVHLADFTAAALRRAAFGDSEAPGGLPCDVDRPR
jgi:hypothetical protein